MNADLIDIRRLSCQGLAAGGHVVIVEDDPDTRELLCGALAKRHYHVKSYAGGDEAIAALKSLDPAVVMTDVQLGGGMTGLELCAKIVEGWPDVPVIVATGFGNMEMAIAAMRAGAYDFIIKPISIDALAIAVGRASHYQQLTSEVHRLRAAVRQTGRLANLIGESPAIRTVGELVHQVAQSDAAVLITGESGTGKELVAHAIHAQSSRKDAPFVALNCAAVPPTLIESELFGHVRGAFTDAKRARVGLFVQASGGTLFLDEIGEMPLEMQAKLLRVLQDHKVRPVGGEEEIGFDARIITATNRDVETEVEEGRLRSDLYYRINVVHIAMPPLRERQSDVLVLAQHFLERQAQRSGKAVVSMSRAAAQKLLEYDWPGNVRELENCMERAVALTRLSEIGVGDLPEKLREHAATQLVIASNNPDEMPTLEEMEQRYVRKVVAAVGGNKTRAARVLGLDRRSLYRRLEKIEGADKAAGKPGQGAQPTRPPLRDQSVPE